MDEFSKHLNELFVDTFRSILKVEEEMLRGSTAMDLTINEMHLIESVGKCKEDGRTISSIAEDIGITLPSVTVAINKLQKKGYVEKIRGEADSRTVFVKLTKNGKRIDAAHRYFHENMVRNVVTQMNEEEKKALFKGVVKLNDFFKNRIRSGEE
ncbi:MAG: MarR family winged helix-turn-helix transcriptional regulator [Bacillota bacterium]